MFSEELLAWHDAHARDLPWRGETDPYRIWISEIMLQQTTTQTVKGYYARFIGAFPTVQALAEAPEQEVLKLWEGLGYYSRARNLQKAAKIVARELGGRLPDTVEALRVLPGIGDYTAGAIASMAYGKAELAMDGNLVRALARLTAEEGCVGEAAVKKRLRAAGMALIDKERPGDFNQAMMGLGRLVCLPGNPKCGECPVAARCAAHAKGVERELPVTPPKAAKRIERRGVALAFSGGRVLVRRRGAGGLLAGLWEFPNFEDACDAASLAECLGELGVAARGGRCVGAATHVFTHLVWKMEGFAFSADALPETDGLRAVDAAGLLALPMPSAMRAFRDIAQTALSESE
ncbi:MAG: A/G-specific adenine glycosylase [Clostridia bacterium]|nr:A/G-specific adenine glycosylase [Clostridia bacterium]